MISQDVLYLYLSKIQDITPNPIIKATAKYTKYERNIENPNSLVIFHLFRAMMQMMAINIANNMRTEQNMPSACTTMVCPVAMASIHGIGNLKSSLSNHLLTVDFRDKELY